MTRYFAFALMLLATSLFVAGCGGGDTDAPDSSDTNGQNESSETDRGDTPDSDAAAASPTPPEPDAGEEFTPAGAFVPGEEFPTRDANIGGGDPGAPGEAATSQDKKSVLGALGDAIYRGAANAASDE